MELTRVEAEPGLRYKRRSLTAPSLNESEFFGSLDNTSLAQAFVAWMKIPKYWALSHSFRLRVVENS